MKNDEIKFSREYMTIIRERLEEAMASKKLTSKALSGKVENKKLMAK